MELVRRKQYLDNISRSLLLAAALLLVQGAFASTPTAAPGSSSCGATVDDRLSAAQRALQGRGDEAALRASVLCLLDATTALNARLTNDESGRPASGVVKVPVYTHEPNNP